MSGTGDSDGGPGHRRTAADGTDAGGVQSREERLAAALRANLARRKAQARARRAATAEDGGPDDADTDRG